MRPDPLIVTLTLDPQAQSRFDALRRAHFPAERLLVGAHVTLFHALPGDEVDSVGDALGTEARAASPFPVMVATVRFLGRGVAFGLQATALTALRARLRRIWADRLTAQDRQGWHPHVTIQNKVDGATARALHAELSASFTPYTVRGTGLALWHYRGGPWDFIRTFDFAPGG